MGGVFYLAMPVRQNCSAPFNQVSRVLCRLVLPTLGLDWEVTLALYPDPKTGVRPQNWGGAFTLALYPDPKTGVARLPWHFTPTPLIIWWGERGGC